MKVNMKSISRILLMIVVVSLLMTFIVSIGALAAIEPKNVMDGDLKGGAKDGITQIMGTILGFMQMAGSIIAVAILAIFGLKWFFASVQTKAQLKEQMWGYVIGAMLVFGAATIMGWLADGVQNTINGSDSSNSGSSSGTSTGVEQRQ